MKQPYNNRKEDQKEKIEFCLECIYRKEKEKKAI